MNHETDKILLKPLKFNLMKRHVCWLCVLSVDDLLCKQLRKTGSRIDNLSIQRATSDAFLKRRS